MLEADWPQRIAVLDQGYVDFVEAWGTGKAGIQPDSPLRDSYDYEVGVVEAARQSTQGSFRGWDEDAKLLKYLYEHKHATPFEFAGMVLEIQAPICVFREHQRHRTQSYNEMSARYAPLPDLYYQPELEQTVQRATTTTQNKQASSAGRVADRVDVCEWLEDLARFYYDAERVYQSALRRGIPKELARLSMPVGHYSRMRCSANLRNWLAFMTLRADPAAQWEIRQFAKAIGEIIAVVFPHTWALFAEHRQ